MRILLCSDGSKRAGRAARLAGWIAARAGAEVDLLGVCERPADEDRLREALEEHREIVAGQDVPVEVTVEAGRPVQRIAERSESGKLDLVVIGAERKGFQGPYALSERVYRIIRAVDPPVLVVLGEPERITRILLAVGERRQVEAAVEFTGRLAGALGARVTLFHVLAEPPAMYGGLLRREEDVDAVLGSESRLARLLRRERQRLEEAEVDAPIRLGHGYVADELLAEQRRGDHDLVVVGSWRAGGVFRAWVIGDVTRQVLDRADVPVLVVRTDEPGAGLVARVRALAGRLLRPAAKEDNDGRGG